MIKDSRVIVVYAQTRIHESTHERMHSCRRLQRSEEGKSDEGERNGDEQGPSGTEMDRKTVDARMLELTHDCLVARRVARRSQ